MRQLTATLTSALVMLTLELSACDGAAPLVEGHPAPRADITIGGKRMTWVRSVPRPTNLSTTPVDPKALATKPTEQTLPTFDPSAVEAPPMERLPTVELAEKLRARVLLNEQEYVSAEPDFEMAQMIKNGLPGSAPFGAASEDSFDQGAHSLVPGLAAKVNDNRFPQANNGFPGRDHLFMVFDCAGSQANGCVRKCSGTLIGPKTAMTAAHCIYDTKVDRWNDFLNGAAGPAPAGVASLFNLTPGCVGWAMPAAYVNGAEGDINDWAVMDFSNCAANQNPSNVTGFIGYQTSGSWTPVANETLLVWGSPAQSFRCQWPGLCGASGTWSAVRNGFVESTNIYASGGQSGTSLMRSSAGNPHIGVMTARSTDDTTTRTRIFDGTLYSFCHSYSDPVRFP